MLVDNAASKEAQASLDVHARGAGVAPDPVAQGPRTAAARDHRITHHAGASAAAGDDGTLPETVHHRVEGGRGPAVGAEYVDDAGLDAARKEVAAALTQARRDIRIVC